MCLTFETESEWAATGIGCAIVQLAVRKFLFSPIQNS
ncbi:MAG: hypothetical protein K0S45_685 [Nitrospira sp.]|jgi:hypothetical protein|nr:hypothetical protein [Nitrospira sp.]